MALAAVKNGEIVVAKGYGFANLNARVPATRQSIFQADSSLPAPHAGKLGIDHAAPLADAHVGGTGI